MGRRIVIIEGHPDPEDGRLCRALADAYSEGAREAGHDVSRFAVANLDFPFLRSKAEFETGALPPVLIPCQKAISHADHLVIVYPLWLGSMPARLKALLEQVFRPGFAFDLAAGKTWTRRLRGKSARIVVTMGMPALAYRWYFGAHSLKSLERNILGFCGIAPIRESLFGGVETAAAAKRHRWLAKMRVLGKSGL